MNAASVGEIIVWAVHSDRPARLLTDSEVLERRRATRALVPPFASCQLTVFLCAVRPDARLLNLHTTSFRSRSDVWQPHAPRGVDGPPGIPQLRWQVASQWTCFSRCRPQVPAIEIPVRQDRFVRCDNFPIGITPSCNTSFSCTVHCFGFGTYGLDLSTGIRSNADSMPKHSEGSILFTVGRD